MPAMVAILMNQPAGDRERRDALFAGSYLVHSASPATRALADHAVALIEPAFRPLDPETAQEKLDVREFVARVGPLKSLFTNHPRTKELIREILAEYGCDLARTYFDVPRMRVVPYGGYLSAGVSYAYRAHRDTWYASPSAQANWWMPIYDVVPERAMSMFPAYWDRRVRNSSRDFDYGEWCRVGRLQAMEQIEEDTRKHPLPLEPVDTSSDLRVCGARGDAFLFSAAHLHSTAANVSGRTRFSFDFRTLHTDDLLEGRGAPNVDSAATGTTLGDFLRAADFRPIDPEWVERETVRGAA